MKKSGLCWTVLKWMGYCYAGILVLGAISWVAMGAINTFDATFRPEQYAARMAEEKAIEGARQAKAKAEQAEADRAAKVGSEYSAKRATWDIVPRYLKWPKTADFAWDVKAMLFGDTWRVWGTVKSENGLGMMVRSRYDCRVKHVGGGQWETVSCLVE